ncbi:transpeptidase-like D-Ala-D-Ala carboxypeptidase VanY-D [Ihubacter sp. rT4E-8]|uniref:transpeptidase-like D-Ala-D-Ala carboxypeptidase VanY-D n=1 Tax=Ihubacter sp. rT4E-8 TaxID=3242369 RepID=UPI003CF9E354
MEYQNNNGNYDNRNRRKAKKKKRGYYRAVCIVLCLLIAVTAFGIVNMIKSGKETPIPGKKIVKNNEDYSLGDGGQSETVSPSLDSANSLSVDITAANAIVINADTNTVLYQKNGTDKIAPASTAKMITALTVLDYCSPDDEMRVGAEIEMMQDDSSRAWLMQGDTLTVRQLLVALMLPSGNDAAYTLAVNAGKEIAGDMGLSNAQAIDVFMDKVNQKAKSLGAENSNFVVPDGYDADGQYTTAYDLAVIAKACLDNPYISEIVASDSSYERWPNGREVTYNNTNELLNPDSQYYLPEVIGLKTGTSSLGGACIVSAAVINGNTYICAVMGSTEDGRYQDSIDIYDAIKTQ